MPCESHNFRIFFNFISIYLRFENISHDETSVTSNQRKHDQLLIREANLETENMSEFQFESKESKKINLQN